MSLNFGIFDWVEASPTLAPAEVYAHKLDLAAAADAAGFHGMFLAEHQGTPLSIDGAPSVLLSAIFQRTRRLRAGALTFCLPWHDPYRLYHEVCMLDHLSGGRLELGVGRGVSPIESRIFGMNSLEESRERYREALEVFFKACANPVLDFDGKIFRYRDTELQVKPRQKPYPPLWFPSSNRESIEFTGRHGYHTAFLGRLADCKPHFDRYRDVWQRHRDDPGRHNAHVSTPFLARTQHLVIADTDAEAERLGLEAYATFFEPHPSPDAQGRAARRAQDHALRRGLVATPDRRLAGERAGESTGSAAGDERELPVVYLFLRQPRAAGGTAFAGAFCE